MKGEGFNFYLLRAGLVFLSVSFFMDIHSQTVIITDSIINEYQKITSIHSFVGSDPDSVYVSDATAFKKDEVVLFIVNQGASIRTEDPGKGDIAELNNTGKYALIYVDTVEYDNNLVIFNSTLPGVSSLNPGEKAQLVTVPGYKNLEISNKLTCKAWDTESGTGGVLVFIVSNMLELMADIDVTGKGFKGAVPGIEQYNGSCSSVDPGYYNDFFTFAAKDSGALRGEGIAETSFLYPRGRLVAGNSGSGGNGHFSGGGGGSNAGAGGKGGKEWSLCSPGADIGGLGGQGLFPKGFYHNSNPYANRIYMGGGGGTGTQDPVGVRFATPGGNGGGLVIFTANKVKASGFSIKANGESVTAVAGAGAGGGGGGGVIIADVVAYSDPLEVQLKGGDGGNVLAGADTTGPGGGGGGGVFWFNQNVLDPAVTSIRTFGVQGRVQGTDNNYEAANGTLGNNIPNLLLPRRGFLVNKIPDDQVICENDVPEILVTPQALGGSGPPYTYKWLQSQISFEGPWISAVGINDQQNYAPPALTDSTYYRRIISDGSLVDTSFAVMVAVHPGLRNNDFIDNDTVCAQLSAGELALSSEMQGGLGTGTYTYNWEQSLDNSTWLPAGGMNNLHNYQTPVLSESVTFRRKVTSGACVDTSNAFNINVLPVLSNNSIEADQIICYGQQPAGLSGSNPAGGLTDDRRYMWEDSNDLESWTSQSTDPAFNPGIQTDTIYYRRKVFSGPENTCEHISNIIKITVLPFLDNNIVNHQDTVICAGLSGLSLTGMQPVGGDGVYKYFWENRPYGSGPWEVSQQSDLLQPFESGSLSDSTWFRRVIKSGTADVCISISDSFLVSVLPVLSNNNIEFPQVICENTHPESLSGSLPSGGTGSYSYEWQKSPDVADNWQSASPVGDAADYAPPALGITTYYRRIVYSGPDSTCQNISESVKIEVQPAIANNSILNGNSVFTCFDTQPELIGGSSNLTGGDGSVYLFTWEESNDFANWIPASQSNSQKDYQPQVLVDSIYYRRLVSSGVCTDTTSFVKVSINSLPVLNSLVSSIAESSMCDDEKLFLKVNIENGKAPFNADYLNTIDAGTFNQLIATDTSSFIASISGGEPNKYIFKLIELTDANGCKASSDNLNLHQAVIDVYRAARPSISLGDLEETCGNSMTLTAIPDVGNGVWRTSTPDLTFSDSLNAITQASFSLTGFNSLTAKFYYVESTPGCGEKKDSVNVIFYEQPDDVIITSDTTGLSPHILFLSDNIHLTSHAPTAGSGSWVLDYGPGEIVSQGNTYLQLSNLKIDEQTKVSYSVVNGVCNVKSSFIVIERKDVKIYEGFSPNGDHLNEYLYAEGIDRSSDDLNYSLSIFNNSGTFVIELNNESSLVTNENNAIWDGIAPNGKPSADGTYYYVMNIDYKGSAFTYKGFFVLKTE